MPFDDITKNVEVLKNGYADVLRVTEISVRKERHVKGDAFEIARTECLKQALLIHNGNRTHAADELGITRRTIHRWIKQYL